MPSVQLCLKNISDSRSSNLPRFKIKQQKRKEHHHRYNKIEEPPTDVTEILQYHQRTPLRIHTNHDGLTNSQETQQNEERNFLSPQIKLRNIMASIDQFEKRRSKKLLQQIKLKKSGREASPRRGTQLKTPYDRSPAIRKHRDPSAFHALLQNRSLSRKITKPKASPELNFDGLRRCYNEHRQHVHLREQYRSAGVRIPRRGRSTNFH